MCLVFVAWFCWHKVKELVGGEITSAMRDAAPLSKHDILVQTVCLACNTCLIMCARCFDVASVSGRWVVVFLVVLTGSFC
jgi:hypothetical protein